MHLMFLALLNIYILNIVFNDVYCHVSMLSTVHTHILHFVLPLLLLMNDCSTGK